MILSLFIHIYLLIYLSLCNVYSIMFAYLKKIGLFVSLTLICKYSLFIQKSNSFSYMCFASIFSKFVACHFTLIEESFEEVLFFILMRTKLLPFAFILHCFWILFKKLLLNPRSLWFSSLLVFFFFFWDDLDF